MWAETFPNAERDMKRRQEQRKKNARIARETQEKLKDMTPEELEEMERNTPEWKRGALVVTDADQGKEKEGVFGSIKQKISKTEAAQKFFESEEYKKLREARGNYSEFKGKLREGIENTQNPAIQRAMQVADLAYTESSCARAIKNMQQYDPYFDFEELEVEATDIFAEFYCNFLSGNLEYLEKVAGGVALAVCKAEFKRREVEGWRNRYDDLLDCGKAVFNAGQMDKVPSFTFIIDETEINCKVDAKNPDEVKEGHDE